MDKWGERTRFRIVLADDQPVVRQGLLRLFEAEPDLEVCAEADEPAKVLRAIEGGRPDMVILDTSLRGSSGIELLKDIRARGHTTPALVFSMQDETLYAERALHAGAQGYIMKQEAADKVIAAVRKVLHGEVYLSERVAERIFRQFASGDSPGQVSQLARLTDRELEVYELLGRGRTTRQIARTLYLSMKTVETHRDHIRAKLKLSSSNELLLHAIHWVEAQGSAGA